MTAVIISTASLFTMGMVHGKESHGEGCDSDYFWPLWLFLWATLNAVFLSRDVFNLYVTLELLVLCAVPLLTLAGDSAALTAGMRYLLVAMLSSMFYLLGVALVYAIHSTLSITELAKVMVLTPAAWVAAVLVTLGLLLKTALFPLHFWLPSAHGNAPTPVSALLSGLVVKATFYLFLRLWFGPFAAVLPPVTGQFLGILGSGAIIWGSLVALRQERLKLIIAYSTVAQVGYLFLLFPLVPVSNLPAVGAAKWGSAAWSGAIYFMISHAFAKASMFLAGGCIARAIGSDHMANMNGIGQYLPLSVFAFALAAVSLIGLPPSGGFIGKWMMLNAAFGAGQWWWALVMNIGGLLSAAYIFMVLRQTLFFRPVDVRFYPVPRGMQVAALALALLSLLLGLIGPLPFDLLEIGSPFALMPVKEGMP
jgi:multicomponent Na+:H+ antiporter subunit D